MFSYDKFFDCIRLICAIVCCQSMLANNPQHLFAISYLAITSSMNEDVTYVAKS